MKCFDAKEPNNPDIQRKERGNNNYKKSNINKWLNSVGNWYIPQHQYDTPPNSANLFQPKIPYDTEPGFLTNMSVNFREKLLSTTLSIDKEIDGKQDYENMEAKVFLLERTGAFNKAVAVTPSTKLQVGDILVTRSKGHTVIVTESDNKSEDKPKPKPQTGGRVKKSVEAVAKEVIEGKWGNNPERKAKLIRAGYIPSEVQAVVNKLLK